MSMQRELSGEHGRRHFTNRSDYLAPTQHQQRKVNGMITDVATELDRQLEECKSALRDQAQAMVAILAEFETQVKARLDAAEARIAVLREFESRSCRPIPFLDLKVGDR